MDSNPLTETWLIGHRVNLYLLDALDESHLADVGPTKGRSVGEQFAHLLHTRLQWLEAAAPDLRAPLRKIEKGAPLTKALLADHLTASAEAIGELLARGAREGRIKGFKPHPTAFLGYLLAHEAHHRGQLLIALKHHRHAPGPAVQFGLWEWGKR